MGTETKIQWCHHTFNPWWGCQRVSPGCEHCYAETFAKRVGQNVWGPVAPRRFFGEKHWREPLKWNAAAEKAGERHRVFCASMADVFEDRPELAAERENLFGLIASTPHLDWLLLTKRPENILRLWPNFVREPGGGGVLPCWPPGRAMVGTPREHEPWPNVWLGTTVEDQQRAEERIPHLIAVPAAVRFLSCEPLLGPVDLSKWMDEDMLGFVNSEIDWVIIGGESGPGARPFDLAWARSLVWQCRNGGRSIEPTPFVKQLGARVFDSERKFGTYAPEDKRTPKKPDGAGGEMAQGNLVLLKDRAGGDMAEWPVELRVREFPEVRR